MLVESLHVDIHEISLGDRPTNISLQYTFGLKSMAIQAAYGLVFEDRYVKLFDVRANAIRTFGLCIRQVFAFLCFQH